MGIKKIKPWIFFLMFCLGCREPFEPEVSGVDHGILVAEGYIAVGGGKSSIKLGRTRPINDPLAAIPVTSANVQILGENGGSWLLEEEEIGIYTTWEYLPEDLSYTLSIHSEDNQQYASRTIRPVITPEIENITFEKQNGNLLIYANTRGNESAEYFIWEYEESWSFRSRFRSSYKYNPSANRMEMRNPEEQRYKCWQENNSKRIIIASTQGYQGQYIHQKELVEIDSLSEKLVDRYSILVRQKAIEKEAFLFWEAIRKNSNDIGGIFSPLPSHIGSNFFNVEHPEEPVIGYISAGKTTEKRIYINHADVAPWNVLVPGYGNCKLETVSPKDFHNYFVTGGYLPLYQDCTFPCQTYLASTKDCADCSLRGNSEMPSFWEEY